MLSKALLAATVVLGHNHVGTPVIRQADGITDHKPSAQPQDSVVQSQGCFSSGANFTTVKPDTGISSGSCSDKCIAEGFWVGALHGPECQCGMVYPPKSSRAKDILCESLACNGYPFEPCGSLEPDAWLVFNLGVELVDVEYYEEPDSTSSSTAAPTTTAADDTSSTAPTTAPSTTDAGDSDESSGEDDDDSGSETNVAAIAAGVSVGVVVILAAIGGGFWYMRRRRNAEIEEDHRRNAAVNAFISGAKPPSSHGSISMSDTRLDPQFAHRRVSDGSIADNHDYSRKILRVTNA